MSSEDMYIKNIENGIRAIRLGTKSPKDVNLSSSFEKLKNTNLGMYQDLLERYKHIVSDYNQRKTK